jgi:hypothetical protein
MTVIEDQPRKIHPTTTRLLTTGDDLSGRHRWTRRQQIDFCEWQRLKPSRRVQSGSWKDDCGLDGT